MKKAISKILSILQSIQYELAVFCLLMLRGLPQADFTGFDGWQNMSYVLSYKYGFGSRLLIGSIMRLFKPDYVTTADAAVFANVTVILDCLIMALALGALLRAAHRRGQLLLAAMPVVLYLTLPMNISIYFSPLGHAGKLEIFLFPLMMVSAGLLLLTRPGTKQTVAVSAITLIAMLIYQNYIFLCFPLILALLVYNLFEYGWNKQNLIHSLVICAVTGISFLYLQLFSKLNYDSSVLLTSNLQMQTNMYIRNDAVYYEYYATFSEFFKDLMLGRYHYQLQTLILDLILISPVIFIAVYTWVHAFRSCETKNDRWLLGSLQLCSAVFLPTYIITCDWARWTIWFIIFQTAIVLILWFRGFKPMITALETTARLLGQYKAITALILVYLFSLSSVSVTEMFVITKTIHNHFCG